MIARSGHITAIGQQQGQLASGGFIIGRDAYQIAKQINRRRGLVLAHQDLTFQIGLMQRPVRIPLDQLRQTGPRGIIVSLFQIVLWCRGLRLSGRLARQKNAHQGGKKKMFHGLTLKQLNRREP